MFVSQKAVSVILSAAFCSRVLNHSSMEAIINSFTQSVVTFTVGKLLNYSTSPKIFASPEGPSSPLGQ